MSDSRIDSRKSDEREEEGNSLSGGGGGGAVAQSTDSARITAANSKLYV